MANEKNDISDIVKTCKILLLDIEGTTTSISFVKDRLFPYVDANVQEFLENDWEVDVVKEAVKALRKLALEDEEQKVEGVVTIPGEDASKEEQIEGLVKSVKWQMSLDRKIAPLKHLQGLVWRKGYDKGDIKGHIYEDVPPALELWRSVEGQKVYIFSSGSVHAQKLLFSMSSAGNIVHLIDGHFDTTLGPKQEAASYTAIAEKIGYKPEEILFLTDIDKEAEAARLAGVHVALMSREGNAPLAEATTAAFPVLYSFAELAATKKRKPDAQDEQQPAKVPKTDVEANVKTLTETQSKDSPQPTTTMPKPKETENEKMEVEEEAPAKEETIIEQAKPEEIVEKTETIVEEITDLKEVADIPVSDTKPVIIESTEKTDQKETEVMETEPADSIPAPKENGDNDAPGPEKSPPVVITEIKDITNDTESLGEVTEIIEDLVPVVEEPPAQDMEDLQNVGEVLDKECDEILSKVQDVTNLDNIPLKPLLNPIAEETMETDNVDSNDIVEGILDSEQELEMKQCSDIDLNTVQEIAEAKTVTGAEKCEKQDVVDKASEKVALEEKRSTNDVEEVKVIEKVKETEKKAADSCPKETNVEESSSTTEVQVKESSSTAEEIDKESGLAAEEKVKESPTEEKILESDVSEEKVQENGVTEEQVKESAVELKMEESSIAEEKTKENTVEQKIEESSITEEKIVESTVEQKNAESSLPEAKTEEQKVVVDEVKTKIEEKKVETKMETDVCTAETQTAIRCTTETQTEEKTCLSTEDKSVTTENEVESKEVSAESSTEKPTEKLAEESSMDIDQTETSIETKDSEKIATPSAVEVIEPEKDLKETQLNGKTTNGDAEMVNQNGDSSKEDELSARLSIENGQEVVNGANGANGDSSESEAKSENKGDEVMDVADIKVKTVAMDEPRNDPIEQPTEA